MSRQNAIYFAIRKLIKDNPAYRPLFMYALKTCGAEAPMAAVNAPLDNCDTVADAVEKERIACGAIQNATSILDMLVNRMAIEQVIMVDDALYDGSMDDLQVDADIPLDAQISYCYRLTPEGAQVYRDEREDSSFEALCAQKPQHKEPFLMVLSLCERTDGATTKDLETPLDEAGFLFRDARTNLPTFYPSYFTGALERIGLLCWDETLWRTTAEGSAALHMYGEAEGC